MSDARERLVEKMVLAGEPLSLDAFLAHPDDLIALLVETGALDCWQDAPEGPGMSGRVLYERIRTNAPEGSRNDG